MRFVSFAPLDYRSILLLVALAACAASASQASAQSNVALGKPIIDGSGSWSASPFNGGSFPASKVVDGVVTEPPDGVISYWLGREQLENEYFTIDLGQNYLLDRIELFNTHNRQFNDRSTDEFALFGATAVGPDNKLLDPIPLLSGNLTDRTGANLILPDVFTPANGLQVKDVRYLRFDALSSTYNGRNVGLNEIRAFSGAASFPNLALNRPVIAGSGAWSGNTPGAGVSYNDGQYPASSVTDGSIIDAAGSYWLGREGVRNEYFTLDLGSEVPIREVLIRNTTNGDSADRGTSAFRILASSAVDGANELIGGREILQGQLPNAAGLLQLPETVFNNSNGLTDATARYLRFETLGDTYANAAVGLNEIEVYSKAIHPPTPLPRPNLAAGKSVIDGSGAFDGVVSGQGASFDGGSFPATRVTDGSVTDVNIGRTSYWLGRERTRNEYFTVDLGQVFTLEEIGLRNTHNTQYNDRGTKDFILLGAQDLDASNQLVNPVEVLRGTLANVSGQNPIAPQYFTSAAGLKEADVRYLKFIASNYYFGPTNGGSGLNDLLVYGRPFPSLAGDLNGDGLLDASDIDALTRGVLEGATDTRLDLSGDGKVDQADRSVWIEQLKRTYFGDANLDGVFNSSDFVSVFQAGQYEDAATANSTWATGDFNGDLDFTSGDFVTAFQGGGYEAAPRTAAASQVPEPCGLQLMALAWAGAAVLRARRNSSARPSAA
jgi:hypothetical protein